MRSFARMLAGLILSGGVLSCGVASAEKALEVIVFPGGFNWPIWVAQNKGYFQQQGVSVNVTPTPSSSYQLSNLIDGKYDIAMTAIDNLIAYREGQGEVDKVGTDLVAVMGADRGFLKLVTVPEVKTVSDLKGRTLSVDARNTGYALVLFELLDRAGLREPDFQVERAGGVMQRFKDLMDKKHAGTMLISPFEVQPLANGYNVLATASQALGSYQGLVAGTRLSWAEDNREKLVGYIRAYINGVEWLYDPANKEEAITIYQSNMRNADKQSAETAYRILLDPETGMQRKAQIEMDGVAQVLSLRSKWGRPQKTLTDPSKYYDNRFYQLATQ
ncbi:NMT1-like family protein [Paraburkholderia xenovorans LB400]|uniref:ABC transporter, periplasmic ligand binding protein n=3 Tax=Burkholderiales TaxID=80840 RepID=Q13VQ9_PARXL|nr:MULTISPECIES: ABC transporter substrate-binding protein [Pseudomonadota]ABE31830.1 Putative ABC transporter, periplasmic ligand binding protein [Paraburkholderia xenovorans LB400]ADP19858.1 NMT1/THI5 like family protein 6 [Achromobacter xylosoxidans A8]AIP29864.1 NMT1-like family protein [Paraburkholderia xenovorans LB400]MBC2768828.1 ABC transporter substrate-binding protein [Pusillimonas minor]